MSNKYHNYPTRREVYALTSDANHTAKEWDAIVAERKAKAIQLPLLDVDGKPFWFVITPYLLELILRIAADRGFLEGVSLPSRVRRRLEKQASDLEAYYSSHIEGAQSTLEEALAFLRKGKRRTKDESLQMIVNNRVALDHTHQEAGKPISHKLICTLQSILTENTHLDRPITRGQYRHGPVYIVDGMGRVVYEGPPHDKVEPMMRAFIEWMNEDASIEPVIRAGIAHLYFVQVHPFDDGNGRTARAISNFTLANAGLKFVNMLSLSDYFDHRRPRYYRAIQDVREHDLDMTYFLIFYAEALLAKLEEMKEEIEVERKIGNIKDIVAADVYRLLNRRQIKGLRVMLRNDERMTTKNYCKLNKCSDETARKDFLSLMEMELVLQEGKGRSVGYVLSEKVTEGRENR